MSELYVWFKRQFRQQLKKLECLQISKFLLFKMISFRGSNLVVPNWYRSLDPVKKRRLIYFLQIFERIICSYLLVADWRRLGYSRWKIRSSSCLCSLRYSIYIWRYWNTSSCISIIQFGHISGQMSQIINRSMYGNDKWSRQKINYRSTNVRKG